MLSLLEVEETALAHTTVQGRESRGLRAAQEGPSYLGVTGHKGAASR